MPLSRKTKTKIDSSFALNRVSRSGLSQLAIALGRKPLLVGALGTAVAGLMAALSLMTLYDGRADALNHSQDTARNVVSMIAKDVSRNLDLYNLTLQSVVDGVQSPEVMGLKPSLRRQVLFDRAASASFLGGEYYVNSSGIVIAQNDQDFSDPVFIGDRDFFVHQATHTDQGLFISSLFESRERHSHLSIGLSRRVAHADGTFNGVAILAVEVGFFKVLLDDVDVGKNGAVAILLDDGSILARKPFGVVDAGQNFASSAVFEFIEGQVDGTFTAVSPVDGVSRIYTFAHIPRTPLVVIVAPAETDVLSAWEQRSLMAGILTCALGSCFIVISWLLASSLRERAIAQAQLVRMAGTDALTGVSNRRVLDYRIDDEWRRARRAKNGISILFIDVDCFKAFNDTYGHAVGDGALVTVADCVGEIVRRPADLVARYGGEEFVAMLPDTPHDAAMEIAEQIRLSVVRAALLHAESPFKILTVSIGCTTAFPADGGDALTVLNDADRALYAAKEAGRNCVMSLDAQRVARAVSGMSSV